MKRLESIQDELIYNVLKRFAIAALIITLVIGIFSLHNAQKRAKQMTKQIIYLYETLEEVI